MDLSVEQAVLATILYFDFYDYPLTLQEIHCRGVYAKEEEYTLDNIIHALDHSQWLAQRVACHQGFYMIKGREHLTHTRRKRYLDTEMKFRKAMRVTHLLALLPFVRMVAASNTMAYANADEKSDIDLLIVVEKGHLWTARLWCNTLMELLGQRPNIAEGKKKDKICLSCYVATDGLNCADLRLPEREGSLDIEFTQWISQMVPIYDHGGVYDTWYMENAWIQGVIPHCMPYDTNPIRRVQQWWPTRALKWTGEVLHKTLGKYPEKWAKQFQKKILPVYLASLLGKGTKVVMNDQIIKTHASDKREEIRERFFRELKESIQDEKAHTYSQQG